MKKRSRLIFAFVLILAIALACQSSDKAYIIFSDETVLACEGVTEYFKQTDEGMAWSVTTYSCNLPCPDESVAFIHLLAKPKYGERYDWGETMSAFCGVPLPENATDTQTNSSSTNTQGDQSTSNAVLPGVLVARVTECVAKDGFINFGLSQSVTKLAEVPILVTMNDVTVSCEIMSDGQNVLSCSLPKNITFPAIVIITVDGIQVSSFTYQGDSCTVIPPGSVVVDESGEIIFSSNPSALVVSSLTPSAEPTESVTEEPTEEPTESPTEEPTEEPTESPTEEPTESPTEEPTEEPTESPTEEPTESPTEEPTEERPTEEPTEEP